MNYDIKIGQDGSPIIKKGDFQPVNFAGFVSQKIYKALMNMDISVVSGIQLTKRDELQQALSGYLVTYFAGDMAVNPQGITVTVIPVPGDDNIKYTVEYEGTSPDGEPIAISSDLMYSVSAGAVLSVDYEPAWLTTAPTDDTISVQFPITIEAITTDVELPIAPSYTEDLTYGIFGKSTVTKPIYLLTESQLTTINNTIDTTFSIPIRTGRTKYQLSSHITDFERLGHIIDSYSFTTLVSDIEFYVREEYGDIVVIVPAGESGTITGNVTLRKAAQVTTKYRVRETLVAGKAFPLRRHSGKYYAIFPRSIQLGDYYIKYTALAEG